MVDPAQFRLSKPFDAESESIISFNSRHQHPIQSATHWASLAEDEQMKNKFGEEWECYAMKFRYWFALGLVR